MIIRKDPAKPDMLDALHGDPKTCALYLSDALETNRPDDISEALRDIGRANGNKVQTLGGGGGMRLDEILDILERAGLRLSAIPASPRQT
jgi:DNA-binding phage protein